MAKKENHDALLDTLVGYYDSFVDATDSARKLAERDRDYYDNKQLTAEEESELKKRGQPPVVINRIKPKVDYLLGLERQTRTDPKAFPRNPQDEDGANAATDAIRFVCDKERFPAVRSDVFENIIVEGLGGAIVEAVQKGEKADIKIRRIPWDRCYYDPHSSERNFYDARFKGVVAWMDVDEAKSAYGENAETIYAACMSEEDGDTHADKPKSKRWVDGKRKRIKLCEVYFKHKGTWYFAVHGKSGFAVDPKPSEYQDEDGQPSCPIELQSCHIDRENNRYGIVRQLVGPQDEVNKRRSKALHLISQRQTVGERGAVDDIQRMKREKGKPDGHIETVPGLKFEFVDNTDMAQANLGLLQEAKQEIDSVGANAALTGKSDKEASGRALESRQQGGMIELGPVMDARTQWQQAIYRQIWARAKQFWTAEMWVRVTDDEKNVRFAGLNVPLTAGEQMLEMAQKQGASPEEMQYFQQTISVDPRAGEIVGTRNNVAEIEVDISLEDAPDVSSLRSEQFALLAEMYKANPQNAQNPGGLSFEWVIEASDLRNKEKILEQVRKGSQPQGPQGPPPEMVQHQNALMQAEQASAAADVQGKQAKAAQEAAKVDQVRAQTEKTMVETRNEALKPQMEHERFQQQQEVKAQQAANRPPPQK